MSHPNGEIKFLEPLSRSLPLYNRKSNKKQCSRQLQCEVPCSVGNVLNSSLFINSSLSSLPSTSHTACCPGGGGSTTGGSTTGGGVWPEGIFHSSCHTLHYHMVLRPKGTSHNQLTQRTQDHRFDLEGIRFGSWSNWKANLFFGRCAPADRLEGSCTLSRSRENSGKVGSVLTSRVQRRSLLRGGAMTLPVCVSTRQKQK